MPVQTVAAYFSRFVLMLPVGTLLLCSVSLAEQSRLFGENPDPIELADFLFADQKQGDTSRTWVNPESTKSINVAVLKIHFEFDSTELLPESIQTIGLLAQAIAAPQAEGAPVVIEGHTDAVGEEKYNDELSRQRAQAVKDFLVDIYQIAPSRLHVAGLGETSLLIPDFPAAAINRRVQIRRYVPTHKQ